MPPLITARVPEMVESVVVAVQVGTPERSANTWPSVPAVVVARALVPFPRRSVFAWTFPHPVPPNATLRMPVTSFARSMREVATTPAVALRKPLRVPRVKELEATRFEVEAVPVTARFVVVALPCTSKFPVVVAPPLMVRPPACVPSPIVVEA